jgi:hypothetical protein
LPPTPPPSSPPLSSDAPVTQEPARPDAEKPGARPKRSVPILVVGAAGAVVSATYAHFAMGMRFSPPLVMMGLGGLTLVLASFALWRVLDPLTRDEEARAVSAQRAPLRLRELEREKQTVLKAIKEIELDYQMKKIAEPDYREMVERYRARALRVMSELAAGDDYRALIERELKDRLAVIRATAAAGTNANLLVSSVVAVAGAVGSGGTPETTEKVVTGACEACGIVNDLDARFCKRCGIALTPPPASVTK